MIDYFLFGNGKFVKIKQAPNGVISFAITELGVDGSVIHFHDKTKLVKDLKDLTTYIETYARK